jgi:hypothetical protein
MGFHDHVYDIPIVKIRGRFNLKIYFIFILDKYRILPIQNCMVLLVNMLPGNFGLHFYLLKISVHLQLSLEIVMWTNLRRAIGSLSWIALCKSTQRCSIIHGNKEVSTQILHSYFCLRDCRWRNWSNPFELTGTCHIDWSSSSWSKNRSTIILVSACIL